MTDANSETHLAKKERETFKSQEEITARTVNATCRWRRGPRMSEWIY